MATNSTQLLSASQIFFENLSDTTSDTAAQWLGEHLNAPTEWLVALRVIFDCEAYRLLGSSLREIASLTGVHVEALMNEVCFLLLFYFE